MSKMLLIFGNRGGYPQLQNQGSERVIRVLFGDQEETSPRNGEQTVRLSSPNWPRAFELQKQLNGLSDGTGQPYSSRIKIEGFEPWWFHQEGLFHHILLPYTRYRYLVDTIQNAKRATIVDAPDDFKRLASTLFEGTDTKLVFKNSDWGKSLSSIFRKLKASLNRKISGVLFGTLSLVCVIRRFLKPFDVLIYSIDKTQSGKAFDSRIESLYTSLEKQKITFVEILWRNVPGLTALRNAVRRRRLSIYMPQPKKPSSVDEFREFVSTTTDSWDDRVLHNIALHYLLPACRNSVCLVKTLMRTLKRIAPEQVFLIDDYRHNHELVVACKLLGIKTQGFQHGQFNRYSVGLMAYGFKASSAHTFDKYYVWSDFFRDLLINSSDLYRDPELLQVTGLPRPAFYPLDQKKRGRNQKVTVLFLCESYDKTTLVTEVTPYLQTLYKDPQVNLLLKMKPGDSTQEISWLNASLLASIEVRSGPIDDALKEADVVVGSYSSALFDAIRCLKPVVIFDTSVWQDLHGLADYGIAQRATSPEEIVKKVFETLDIPKRTLSSFRRQVWGEPYEDSGPTYDFQLSG